MDGKRSIVCAASIVLTMAMTGMLACTHCTSPAGVGASKALEDASRNADDPPPTGTAHFAEGDRGVPSLPREDAALTAQGSHDVHTQEWPRELAALDEVALGRLSAGEQAIVLSAMLSNVEEFRARLEEIGLLLQSASDASKSDSLTEDFYSAALRMELEGRFATALQQGSYWVTNRRLGFGGAPVPAGYRGKTYSGAIVRQGIPVDVVVVVDVRHDDVVKALTEEGRSSMLRK